MRSSIILALTACVATAACATLPEVTQPYLFSVADTNVSITQSLACTADAANIISAVSVTTTSAYSADNNGPRGLIRYPDYGGVLKDIDVGPSFTPDGRLSAINATSTGEGSSIAQSAITLAAAVAATSGAFLWDQKMELDLNGLGDTKDALLQLTPKPKRDHALSPKEIQDFCAAIGLMAGGKAPAAPAPAPSADPSKVVALSYALDFTYVDPAAKTIIPNPRKNAVDYSAENTPRTWLQILGDNPTQALLKGRLSAVNFPFHVKVEDVTDIGRSPSLKGYPDWKADWDAKAPSAPSGFQLVRMKRTKLYSVAVFGPNSDFTKSVPIWRGQVSVPVNDYYPLAVPAGVVFGKQGFALTVGDDGAVTKLDYSANTGLTDVAAVGAAYGKTLPTPANEASAKQAKADDIYETNRLAQCRASPSTCPGK